MNTVESGKKKKIYHARYRLTWTASGMWRKKYKKKMYYFTGKPTKEKSYGPALAAWERLKVSIDQGLSFDNWQASLQVRTEPLELARLANDADELTRLQAEIDRIRARQRQGQPFPQSTTTEPLPITEGVSIAPGKVKGRKERASIRADIEEAYLANPVNFATPTELAVMNERKRIYQGKDSAGTTVKGAFDLFVSRMNARRVSGDLKAGSYFNLRRQIQQFIDFLGNDFPISTFTEAHLTSFHTHLISLKSKPFTTNEFGNKKKEKIIKNSTLNVKWNAVKRFLKFCIQNRMMPALLNIDSNEFYFKQSPTQIQVYTPEQVQQLLKYASERTKLYCLLALNCAFYQVDVASLKQSEVNWATGEITRRRTKTSGNESENIPTVTYKLWKETFTLLRKFRSKEELVLVNQSGNPLLNHWAAEKPDGSIYMKNDDNITPGFNRAIQAAKKAGIELPFTFKYLRKTASTILFNSEYRQYNEYFLGNSAKGITERHYSAVDNTQFYKALDFLYQKLFCL